MDWNSDLEVVRFATEGKADLLARQIPNASMRGLKLACMWALIERRMECAKMLVPMLEQNELRDSISKHEFYAPGFGILDPSLHEMSEKQAKLAFAFLDMLVQEEFLRRYIHTAPPKMERGL